MLYAAWSRAGACSKGKWQREGEGGYGGRLQEGRGLKWQRGRHRSQGGDGGKAEGLRPWSGEKKTAARMGMELELEPQVLPFLPLLHIQIPDKGFPRAC